MTLESSMTAARRSDSSQTLARPNWVWALRFWTDQAAAFFLALAAAL